MHKDKIIDQVVNNTKPLIKYFKQTIILLINECILVMNLLKLLEQNEKCQLNQHNSWKKYLN